VVVSTSGSEERVERQRVERIYARYREAGAHDHRWSPDLAGNRLILDERARSLDAAFSAGVSSVLDLGCGSGGDAPDLLARGVANFVVGVDLQQELIGIRQSTIASSPSVAASASSLPFRSNTFDAIIASTLLSSVLDASLRSAIATEAMRVLRPGGRMIIYDMRFINPANREVRPIGLKELTRLFGGSVTQSEPVTLIPQVARRLSGPRADIWYRRLARLPIARSHRFTILTKPSP
jgi:ubiquinone/menaquinone biosynthesis C-methylase UbiE